MRDQISFRFDIVPITKDNVKIMGKQGRFFLPAKWKNYERELQTQFLATTSGKFQVIEDELDVEIDFFFADKRKRDVLNYTKSFCDAFNGFIWKDDSLIRKATVTRFYDPKRPGVELTILAKDVQVPEAIALS